MALFGFALVAAAGLRRGIAGERRRLAQRGATRSQLFVASLTEVGAIALAGWLVGIVVGAIAIAAIASAKDLPAGATVEHALWTRDALLVLPLAASSSPLAVLLAVSTGEESTERRSRVRALDVVALGAVLAVAVGRQPRCVARRSRYRRRYDVPAPAARARLHRGRTGRGPPARAADAAGRACAPGARRSRFGSQCLRLARAPARTAAAGAFLVVTVSLIVFAAAYAATLERGARDEAAFAVPLDVTVTSGGSLVQPLDAASVSRYERVASGVRAFPALRTTAEAGRAGTDAASPTVLGVAPDALARMRWRGDYANRSRAAIVRALTPDRDVSLRSVAIPAGTTVVSMRTQLRGEPLSLALVLRDKRGRISRAPLGIARAGSSTLTARLRAGAGSVLGLEIALTPSGRAWLLHLYNEGRLVRAPSGVVSLGRLTTGDGDAITNWGDWVPRGQTATIRGRYATRLRVAYAFEEAETLRLRPRQPTDGYALPVLASPAVAAAAGPDGRVTLDYLTNQVDGSCRRGRQALSDDRRGRTVRRRGRGRAADGADRGRSRYGHARRGLAVDARRPARPSCAGALAAPVCRSSSARRARGSTGRRTTTLSPGALPPCSARPLSQRSCSPSSDCGRRCSATSGTNATRSSISRCRAPHRRRCERISGYARSACLRSASSAEPILGFLLSRLVASVVQVTGTATDPFPPLVLDWGARSVAVALALLVVLSVVVVEATVRGAFRAEAPERTSWSFE